MFAFALWDSRHHRLHLVRDRLGVKPLYVAQSGSSLAFASESRALIALPFLQRQLNPEALVSYLLHSYVVGEASIWRGIERVPPGHRLEIDLTTGQCQRHRWWSPPVPVGQPSTADVQTQFNALFESSVSDALISDVPVGLFLSGGLDSSAIAAVASAQSPHLHSFSIGFEGWERSETPAARTTAELLSNTHVEGQIGRKDFENLKPLLGAFDEPIADSSIFPSYAVAALARRHTTVALAGDGADELLAGYSWYQQMVHPSQRKQLAWLAHPALKALGQGHTPLGRRCDPLHHYRLLTTPALSLAQIRTLLPWLPSDQMPPEETSALRHHAPRNPKGLRRWQLLDFSTYMPDCNLMVADRASMAHGLEVRVPFLDHRLVELLLSTPTASIPAKPLPKQLLVELLESRGLQHLLKRRKQGFSTPVANYWPAERMHAQIRSSPLIDSGLIDRQGIEQVINSCDEFSLRILAILSCWAQVWQLS
jgi:asparagine synthase (glutamine-hydrolysing)